MSKGRSWTVGMDTGGHGRFVSDQNLDVRVYVVPSAYREPLDWGQPRNTTTQMVESRGPWWRLFRKQRRWFTSTVDPLPAELQGQPVWVRVVAKGKP